MPDIANRHTHTKVVRTIIQDAQTMAGAGGRGKHIRHSRSRWAGGGISPVDPAAVPRGPGRRAHPHGSGQLARIRTPSGVSPRLATPAVAAGAYSAVQGAFRCGLHPAAFEALYGRSRDLSLCRPPPTCAPSLKRADAVLPCEGLAGGVGSPREPPCCLEVRAAEPAP